MDAEIPVLTGYLNVPMQSGFSLNRISRKKPNHRYCLLFKSSRHGIERLEICESKDDKNPKIITLENCVKISQGSSPTNLIQIVKKNGTLTLNTLTDDDQKEWINALQTVAFRDKNSTLGCKAIEEDNDLYCSSFGDGFFVITLIPSDTSIRSNIEPKTYMLHLTATELQLKSVEDLSIIIAKWPYRFIRKYGYRDGKFTFEAGRKCSTGEGVFTLDHTNPQEVFRCMSAKMKSMKKLMSGENIECGENQLNAAASMEAGSRSPLPPSPSNLLTIDYESNSTQSTISLRGFISSTDSLNNISGNSNTNYVSPITKLIPNKPPRKLPTPIEKLTSTSPSQTHLGTLLLETKNNIQLSCDKTKKFQNYEPVAITTSIDPNKNIGSTVLLVPTSSEAIREGNNSPPTLPIRNESTRQLTERDYESVETITNAWKTLGIDDVKHTERLVKDSNDDELLDFVRQRSLSHQTKISLKEPTKPTTKIIDIDIGEVGNAVNHITDGTYDRLDFLSPNNKASSGYKTIVTVTSNINRLRNKSPTSNDYEPIASPNTQSFRKADDSHLGYGFLRRSTTGSVKTFQTTIHNDNNNPSTTSPSDPLVPITQRGIIVNNESVLDDRACNKISYSMVSKPKRV